MAARSNLASSRRTVAALRKASRLGDEHAALIALVESTGRALDDVLQREEKAYAIGALARAHLLGVQALLGTVSEEALDPFRAFIAGLATPTMGSPDGPSS